MKNRPTILLNYPFRKIKNTVNFTRHGELYFFCKAKGNMLPRLKKSRFFDPVSKISPFFEKSIV